MGAVSVRRQQPAATGTSVVTPSLRTWQSASLRLSPGSAQAHCWVTRFSGPNAVVLSHPWR